MRQITIPDEIAAGLQAIADLEGVTVTEVAAPALLDMLAERYHAVQSAYVALRELDPDNGKPTRGRSVSANGATRPKKPAKNNRTPTAKGGSKKAPAGARCQAGAGNCRSKYAARDMCHTHYKRWQDGTLERAPDGTLSPVLEADEDEPSEPVETPEPDTPPADDTDGEDPPRGSCQAARCGEDALPGGAKFCQHHTSQVPRLAEKLRRSHNPPSNASAEAVRRLIEGVR